MTDNVIKNIPYWPHCEKCKEPFRFDKDEPFAHCNCGTSEWGNPRPYPWIKDPGELAVKLDFLSNSIDNCIRECAEPEALADPTLRSIDQIATSIRDLREKLTPEKPQPPKLTHYDCGVLHCGAGNCVHKLLQDTCPNCSHQLVLNTTNGVAFCSNHQGGIYGCDYEVAAPVWPEPVDTNKVSDEEFWTEANKLTGVTQA